MRALPLPTRCSPAELLLLGELHDRQVAAATPLPAEALLVELELASRDRRAALDRLVTDGYVSYVQSAAKSAVTVELRGVLVLTSDAAAKTRAACDAVLSALKTTYIDAEEPERVYAAPDIARSAGLPIPTAEFCLFLVRNIALLSSDENESGFPSRFRIRRDVIGRKTLAEEVANGHLFAADYAATVAENSSQVSVATVGSPTDNRDWLLQHDQVPCASCERTAHRDAADAFDLERDRSEAIWRCSKGHVRRLLLRFNEWQKVHKDRWLIDAGSRLELKQSVQCPSCGKKVDAHYVSGGGVAEVAEHFELSCSDHLCSFRGFHAPRSISATLRGRLRAHGLTLVLVTMSIVGGVIALLNMETIREYLGGRPGVQASDAGPNPPGGASGAGDTGSDLGELRGTNGESTGGGVDEARDAGGPDTHAADQEGSTVDGRGSSHRPRATPRPIYQTRCVVARSFRGRAQQSPAFSIGACTGMRPGAPVQVIVTGSVSVPDRAIGASAQFELHALGATDSYSCNTDLVTGCRNGGFTLTVDGVVPEDGIARASIYPAECSSHGRPNVTSPASQCDFNDLVILICDEGTAGACDPP